jgi:GGDEF domain-containing protein
VSDLLELAAARWDVGSFWEGNLWLKQSEGQRCAVWLSWVALRDGYGRLVQSIGFMRDMTMQRSAQKQIEQLAYSDALTGLPNRLSLSRHVQAAITAARFTQQPFSILFLDLDRFKIINDSLGHDFGDRVLKLVAQRLSGLLRPADVLCRQGGDEFVLYLHDCTGKGLRPWPPVFWTKCASPSCLTVWAFPFSAALGLRNFRQMV